MVSLQGISIKSCNMQKNCKGFITCMFHCFCDIIDRGKFGVLWKVERENTRGGD